MADAKQVAREMTFAEFSRANRDRCESPTGFDHQLHSWSTSDWFTAILGELGEAANVAKKLNRVRDGIRGNKETTDALRDKLRQELGDVFVYLDLLAQSLGFNIGHAAEEVFDAKSKEIGYAALLRPHLEPAAPVSDEPCNQEHGRTITCRKGTKGCSIHMAMEPPAQSSGIDGGTSNVTTGTVTSPSTSSSSPAPQPNSLADFLQRVGKELGRRTNLLDSALADIRQAAEEELRANTRTVDSLDSVEVQGNQQATSGRTDRSSSEVARQSLVEPSPSEGARERAQRIVNESRRNNLTVEEIEAELEAYAHSLSQSTAQIDLEPLKKVCDRDWKDETPQQIINIAANAIYWRDREIEKLQSTATMTREPYIQELAAKFTQSSGPSYDEIGNNLVDAHVCILYIVLAVTGLLIAGVQAGPFSPKKSPPLGTVKVCKPSRVDLVCPEHVVISDGTAGPQKRVRVGSDVFSDRIGQGEQFKLLFAGEGYTTTLRNHRIVRNAPFQIEQRPIIRFIGISQNKVHVGAVNQGWGVAEVLYHAREIWAGVSSSVVGGVNSLNKHPRSLTLNESIGACLGSLGSFFSGLTLVNDGEQRPDGYSQSSESNEGYCARRRDHRLLRMIVGILLVNVGFYCVVRKQRPVLAFVLAAMGWIIGLGII